MKKRFVAVMITAVLVFCGGIPALAAETEEGMSETGAEEAVQEEMNIPETYEEPVEITSLNGIDVSDREKCSVTDENGMKWEVTKGRLTVSGSGVIEENNEFIQYLKDYMPYITFDEIAIEGNVTKIGDNAFAFGIEKSVTGKSVIKIPNTITEIGENAFSGCDLSRISIPSSVSEVGNGAFSGCILGTISFPAGETEIKENMFSYSTIKEIFIPDSVTKIGACAFKRCNLPEIELPNSITEIGANAFEECSLSEIVLPSSVTEIGEYAFSGCDLSKISIPGSVTEIKYGMFQYCSFLEEVFIPNGVRKIGNFAFAGCPKLKSVFLPNSLTEIGEWIFSGSGMEKLTIPDSIETIRYAAFYRSQISEITIPASVKSIEHGAFLECFNLKTITFLGDMPAVGRIENSKYLYANEFEPFQDVVADVYYPAGNQSYSEELKMALGSGLTWKILEEKPEQQPDMAFSDVQEIDWYYDAVGFVFARGIMTGMNNTEFGPSVKLSRSHIATILYRMENEPEIIYDPTAFSDVADNQFYTNAVMWARSIGVITGYEDGRFGPSDENTREQMAVMMYRYANAMGLDTSRESDLGGFPDAGKVSGFADSAVKWAVGEGLIQGDRGNINPQGTAERAQCAIIIKRFMETYGL